MGYNYRTTDPQDTDFIYQAPTNLMLEALQKAEQFNDQQVAQTDILGNAIAKVSYLPTDEAAVKAKQASYEAQIKDISDNIIQDPANYRKHMPALRDLTRNLTSDLTDGELASYQNKANQLAEFDKNNHERVLGTKGKSGTVDAGAYQAARAKFLSDYDTKVQANGGRSYNPNTKASIPFNTEDLVDTPNINKTIADATEKIKANSTDWAKDSVTGQWIFTNKSKNESVERARVAQVALDTVTSDPHITSYLKQGSKLGYLQGAHDADGNFISPYTTDSKGEIKWNPSSMLTSSLRAAVGRDSFKKSETDQSIKDNPYGIQANNFGHQEKMAQLNSALGDASKEKAANLALRNAEELALFKNNLKDQLAAGASKTKLTSSPDGVTTISPFAGDGELTADKLNKALIPQTQSQMADLLAKTKDPNLSDNQRGLFQQQYDQQQALFEQYSDWSAKAHDAAIKELTGKYDSKDLAGYTNYINNTNGMKDQLNASITSANNQLDAITNPDYIKALGTKAGTANIPRFSDPTKARLLLQHIQQVTDQIDKYNSIDSKINKAQDNWYKTNSKETNISLKGVGLSGPNKQLIYDRLKLDPTVEIHDLNTDKSTSANEIQGVIQKVLEKGKDLSDYIDVKTINPPAPGVGTTVTFRLKKENENVVEKVFRHDMFNNAIYDHDMVMTLPADVLNAVGHNMKQGTSDTEKGIGDLITNQSKSSLLSAFSNRIMSKDSDQPISVSTIYDPGSRQRVKITLVPLKAEGTDSPQSYKAYVADAQGKNILFTTKANPLGEFSNTQAVVNAMMP